MQAEARANLWRIPLVRFALSLPFMTAVFVPFFVDWGGLSLPWALSLNAVFLVSVFLLEVPTGSITDHFGRRGALLLGGLLGAVGSGVMVSTPRFEAFVLGEVLMATGYALASGADGALYYDSLVVLGRRSEAPQAFSRLQSVKLAGIVVASLIGSAVADAWGLRAPWVMMVGSYLLAAGLALGLHEMGPVEKSPATEGPSLWIQIGRGLALLRREPGVRRLVANLVGTNSVAFTIIWLYQPRLEELGVPLWAFGWVHAALALGQIAVLVTIDRWIGLLGSSRRFLALTALGPVVGFALLAIASGSSSSPTSRKMNELAMKPANSQKSSGTR